MEYGARPQSRIGIKQFTMQGNGHEGYVDSYNPSWTYTMTGGETCAQKRGHTAVVAYERSTDQVIVFGRVSCTGNIHADPITWASISSTMRCYDIKAHGQNTRIRATGPARDCFVFNVVHQCNYVSLHEVDIAQCAKTAAGIQ